MQSFSRWVVKYHKLVIVAAILLLIPAIYGMVNTKINYDLLTYLPKDLNSVQGQTILEKDFKVAGNAFLLVEDKHDWEVGHLKENIQSVKGVEKVIWIDDLVDITIPREFVPQKVVDQFYKGNSTLLQVEFQEGSGSEGTVEAINGIKTILDENMYLGGTSAVISDLRMLMDNEKVRYLVLAVILIFLILSLTLSSLIIPVLFLLSIGVAIAYNLGTNYLLGSVSYVTGAIAAVLQLGVTMDFSIFLMHRYLEEREKWETTKEAMAHAIQKTFVAIGASSMTAMAGFLSLSVMQIGIGKDMGIVMAKGVALGVIISLTLLPSLILISDGLINRFRHKILLPNFHWTAKFVSRKYWVLLVLFLVLLVPAWYGKENVDVFYNMSDALPKDIQSIQATDYIKQRFGSSDTVYLITPSQERWKVDKVSSELRDLPGVVNLIAPTDYMDVTIPEKYIPKEVADSFSNGTYDYMVIQSKYRAADSHSAGLIKSIREISSEEFSQSYLSGESVLTDDMINLADHDQKAVDLWSIGAILIILTVTFLSLSLPIILVLVIEFAIFINMGIPYFMHQSIPFIALLTIGAIQLGSCINYAILMVSRYKEELALHDKFTAVQNAVKGTARSIVTSALALFFATVGVGYISKVDMIGSLSMMIARGALISMVAILFFLPALLVICQEIIEHTSLHWNRGVKTEGGNIVEKEV